MTKIDGHCMKCKTKREIVSPEATQIKKGTWAVKGKCVVCGTKMFKIVGKTKPIL